MKNEIDDTVSLAKWIVSITDAHISHFYSVCHSWQVANWHILHATQQPFPVDFLWDLNHFLDQGNISLPLPIERVTLSDPKILSVGGSRIPQSFPPRSRSSPWVLKGRAHLNPPSSQSHPDVLIGNTNNAAGRKVWWFICWLNFFKSILLQNINLFCDRLRFLCDLQVGTCQTVTSFQRWKTKRIIFFESRGAHKVRD